MEQICGEVSLFLEDHPEADYTILLSRFGKSENIAASYIEAMGTAEILRKMHIRRWILSVIAIVLAFIVLTWAVIVTNAVIKNERDIDSHIETVITTN